MNTPNETHDFAQPADPPDRLVDLALTELVGRSAPPDLSSRIAAATFRQTAAVVQVPRTRQDRAFWVHLAVAVMLLIGVTIVLLPPVQSARESARVAAVEDRLGNETSRPVPVSSPAPLSPNTKATAETVENPDFDSISDLVQSTVVTDSYDVAAKAAKPADNLSLGTSPTQFARVASAQP